MRDNINNEPPANHQRLTQEFVRGNEIVLQANLQGPLLRTSQTSLLPQGKRL